MCIVAQGFANNNYTCMRKQRQQQYPVAGGLSVPLLLLELALVCGTSVCRAVYTLACSAPHTFQDLGRNHINETS
jgi:hypothetical protein